jgi:hypothetical protein
MLSARDLTRLCMFSLIYYLLIMNWNWARTPDYNEITNSLERTQMLTRKDTSNVIKRLEWESDIRHDTSFNYLSKVRSVIKEMDSIQSYLKYLKIEVARIDKKYALKPRQLKKELMSFIVQKQLDSVIFDLRRSVSITIDESVLE